LFPDPTRLAEIPPAEVLEAAAKGHLGLDHRFLHSLIGRPAESLPPVLAFAERDLSREAVDLSPDFIALFRYWKTPDALPFFIRLIRESPEEIPDEVTEALVEIGAPALEPLLALYEELEKSQRSEVAFILANLGVRDDRILKLLRNRGEDDPEDAAFLLEIYEDPNRRRDDEPFDIWSLYPAEADIPIESLDEDERAELLEHPVASVRAAAANTFFNRELSADLRDKLLQVAKHDESATVRARAWEALTSAAEDPEIVDAMLRAMRNPETPVEELAGLLVGLAPEADRNEVRSAMMRLYERPEGRAKALEAMWRSLHPSFREFFSKHLDDPDLEIRRGAVWGVGYYGLRSELDRLRKLFDDEGLRSDALFAYTLALPGDVSRGRMKALLSRIEKDARGLSEAEEELVKAALDERLMLAGKEPVFVQQED